MDAADIVLWLFIINLGTAFGAGIYEARIVIPQWAPTLSEPGFHWNAELARTTASGPKFWAYVTTVPLTLLTAASLVAVWQEQGARRDWWLAAAIVVLCERTATFAYFIPTMAKLQRETLRTATIKAMVSRWVYLNYGRNALYLIAWLAALAAL